MKCSICEMDNQLSPKEFYDKTCTSYGNRECVQSNLEKRKRFVDGRWKYIESIRPKDSIAIALNLAKKFRKDHQWCQKGYNKGNCLTASDELTRVFDLEAISSSVQFGSMNEQTHCWVEILCTKSKERFIIDVTADQFDFCEEEIVCIPISEMEKMGYEYERINSDN